MKKQLLFAAMFLCSLGAFAQATWIPQATGFTPVSSGVRYISAVDSNVVWICAYDGSGGAADRQDYSHTIDGGASWIPGVIPCPTTYDWSMIYGTDANNAWAVLYDAAGTTGGGIWHTEDGGGSWTQQGAGAIYHTAAAFPNVVHFWNDQEGFAMGDPNPFFEIYTTSDGGTNWNPVPQANIPAHLTGEFGIVGHYNVIGDTIWFDTNKGRVYRSIDRGSNWTVAATGLVVPTNGAMDICFYNNMNGLARIYNATTFVSTMKVTADGGDTWTTAVPSGLFFGSDVKRVPGTQSMIVSTGAVTGDIGTSYSTDGGLNWITIETDDQRTALGIVDSLTMWTGGFTTSPTSDGIYKWVDVPIILCTDANINPGTTMISIPSGLLCYQDSLIVTSTGVYAPTDGAYSGVSWLISSADITGSSDPLNETSLIGYYGWTYPAPSTSTRAFYNDTTLQGATPLIGPTPPSNPYGTYYWTPVVFGNATAGTANPTFLGDLNLDPNCTFTGTSLPVQVLPPGDPQCTAVGVKELTASFLTVTSSMLDRNTANLNIKSAFAGKATVQLFDISGRSVKNIESNFATGANSLTFDVSTLSTGSYMVKVQVNGVVANTKIVKM
jgi:hypothetical protein